MTERGSSQPTPRPRLGFLGLGWIGRMRLQQLAADGLVEVAALADPDERALRQALGLLGDAHPERCRTLEQLLGAALDGIVIATPTAQHAEQAQAVLQAGLPVFCQKPLGRDAGECRAVIEAAAERDLRLGVDMSYRHLRAVRAICEQLAAGAIAQPHALELVFHNAYEPGGGWAHDRRQAGGGALVDLGWHLLDLAALWLGELAPVTVHADLFSGGERLERRPGDVEDLALVQMTLAGGQALRLACSWRQSTGSEAVIEATLFGRGGALRVGNVGGSFYDFEALLLEGTRRRTLCAPPDRWGARALGQWARSLGCGFDPGVRRLIAVAEAIDMVYCGALEGARR